MFNSVLNQIRYQPEHRRGQAYQRADTEEGEQSDDISIPSMGFLPGAEERFSFKTVMFPDNPEPSVLSGFTVNVCVSLMGRCQTARLH